MIFTAEFYRVFLTVNYYKQTYRLNFGTVESIDWNFILGLVEAYFSTWQECWVFQKYVEKQGKHLPT
jgi:hypothetical protein